MVAAARAAPAIGNALANRTRKVLDGAARREPALVPRRVPAVASGPGRSRGSDGARSSARSVSSSPSAKRRNLCGGIARRGGHPRQGRRSGQDSPAGRTGRSLESRPRRLAARSAVRRRRPPHRRPGKRPDLAGAARPVRHRHRRRPGRRDHGGRSAGLLPASLRLPPLNRYWLVADHGRDHRCRAGTLLRIRLLLRPGARVASRSDRRHGGGRRWRPCSRCSP